MTDLLLDLASYQAGLDLSRPAFTPWNRVNIKTSQGNWYLANRQRSRAWADQARATGRGIMTFHWLDMSTTGAEQARIAYQEMRNLGGPDGMAHQADTEDNGNTYGPMTYRVWRDYVNAMQDLMGRHVINYTGDWWWPQGWDGAAVTPYLMAAPNAGYPGTYPGDDSPHWAAGYGGWGSLAAMQFGVGPIPNGGPGAGSVSMTAIRDPQVWAALTGNTTQKGWLAMLSDAEQADLYRRVCNIDNAWYYTALNLDQIEYVDGSRKKATVPNRLKPLAATVSQIETAQAQPAATGAPTDAQVDAAILKAMLDPTVQKGIGDQIASHLKVT